MRRRLFTFPSFLSMLLCATTVALWARSYWAPDRIAHADGTEIEAISNRGTISLSVTRWVRWNEVPPHYGWRHDHQSRPWGKPPQMVGFKAEAGVKGET